MIARTGEARAILNFIDNINAAARLRHQGVTAPWCGPL
jgi:hypothetical protein